MLKTVACLVLIAPLVGCSDSSSGGSGGGGGSAGSDGGGATGGSAGSDGGGATGGGAGSGATGGVGTGGGGGASPYDKLCKLACEKKDGCGLLNPTTIAECEFGCVQTLGVTLSCTPSASDIQTCETETTAADCIKITQIGGAVPCNLCP